MSAIRAGTRWKDDAAAFAPGTRLESVKVMAVVDGYVMARRSGCMPFCMSVKDFERRFSLAKALATEA